MSNNKTAVISSRLPLQCYNKLNHHSNKEKIPMGTLVTQILSRHTNFESNRLERKDILLPKTLTLDILSCVPETKHSEIAEKYVSELISFLKLYHEKLDFSVIDNEYRNFHDYNFLNLNVFEHAGHYIYKCYHNSDKNWSLLFSMISEKLFESVGCAVIDIETTSTFFSFTVKFEDTT